MGKDVRLLAIAWQFSYTFSREVRFLHELCCTDDVTSSTFISFKFFCDFSKTAV